MEYTNGKEDSREDLGTYESDPETNEKIKKLLAKQDGKDISNLEKLARVALNRFPELELGETISSEEIKRRLREIRKLGYNVQSYRGMDKGDLFRYLNQIRRDIRNEARKSCPGVLQEIDNANLEQKLKKYYIR